MKTRRFIYKDQDFAYISCEITDTDETIRELMGWMRKLEHCKGIGEFISLMNDINKFYKMQGGLVHREKPLNLRDYRWTEYVYVKYFDECDLHVYNFGERVLV